MDSPLPQVREKAEMFVREGCHSIIHEGNFVTEKYSISPSPVSTALAAIALLTQKQLYKNQANLGLFYLDSIRKIGGWGKTPVAEPDAETTLICQTAFKCYLEGVTPESIHLVTSTLSLMWLREVPKSIFNWSADDPILKLLETLLLSDTAGNIMADLSLQEFSPILSLLPANGRPLILALSCIRENKSNTNSKAVMAALKKITEYQTEHGSWSEDMIITSICILCLVVTESYPSAQIRGLNWLQSVQYQSGAWPSFARMSNWDIGLTTFIARKYFNDNFQLVRECGNFLSTGANFDGSYGMVSPYSFPDLDDTSVVLRGLAAVSDGFKYRNQITKTAQLLINLQNPDGSWGTFPEVNNLPPDCTCFPPVHLTSADVTVHVLQALLDNGYSLLMPQILRGLWWLANTQELDGSWKSTWYCGNTYATAQVLELLADYGVWPEVCAQAKNWLLSAQSESGGWPVGSAGECGLAVTALLKNGEPPHSVSIQKGIHYISSLQQSDGSFKPAYGGVYSGGLNYEDPIPENLAAIKALKIYELFKNQYI